MNMRLISALACGMTALSGCVNSTTPGGAIETELCVSWGESLPTRSRQDTPQTTAEIQTGYADFANACPALAYLIPTSKE